MQLGGQLGVTLRRPLKCIQIQTGHRGLVLWAVGQVIILVHFVSIKFPTTRIDKVHTQNNIHGTFFGKYTTGSFAIIGIIY